MNPSSSHNLDAATLSTKFRRWWSKGVTPRTDLAAKMSTHVEGIIEHAADIQRVAELEGDRIRREALDSAARMLQRVEAVELELTNALATVKAGRQALEDGLAAERAQIARPAPVARLVRAAS